MTDRSPWLIALATANFILLVVLAFFVRSRVVSVEERLDTQDAAAAGGRRGEPTNARRDAQPVSAQPEDVSPARSPGQGREAPSEEPKPGTLADVIARLQRISNDLYDHVQEDDSDHREFKRTLQQVSATVKKIHHSLSAPGTPSGEWLFEKRNTAGKPVSKETVEAYRRDAAGWGVSVDPVAGRAIVRGFLNMSPWTTMPIEYFITRYPESGHETLLHVVGPASLEEINQSPDKLRGLPTAIYKGMVAAGFVEGECARFDPPAPGDKDSKPKWVGPTGDDVYVGVRYTLGGQVHVARATDWVVDPDTKAVLPEMSFKFIGSQRQDDFQSGDEQVSAEAGGIIVSVYSNLHSLVEIALADNLENRYQYNHARIPKPAVLRLGKDGPLLEGVRDRAKSSLTLKTIERDGKPSPIESAPVLLGRTPNGDEVELAFKKNADGTWTVTSDALAKGEWKVRADVDGKPVET